MISSIHLGFFLVLYFSDMSFKEDLKSKMDKYVHYVYRLTKKFPRDELYGVTSQLRRSSLSVILNYVEGYARRKPKSQLQFFEISFASLKESIYLVEFSLEEDYMKVGEYKAASALSDEIGAMLWHEIRSLDRSIRA